MPLLDLAAFDLDQIQKDLIDLKIAQSRRVLPLAQARQPALRRHLRSRQPAGAGGGPVQDQPRRRADRRRGRQARAGDRQARRGDRRDAEGHRQHGGPRGRPPGRQSGGQQRRGERRGRGRAGRQVHPEDPARRDLRRRLGHPLRAVREVLPDPLPPRRHPDGGRAAAARDQGQGRVADQGHLQARHLRKARPAGRADEARAVQDQGDRLPREHAADALRREDRDADSRLVGRQARHRGAGLRARPAAGAAARRSAGRTG